MTLSSQSAREEQLERDLDTELRHIVGVGNEEYERALAVHGPLPTAMFNKYVELVDRSGVIEQLEKWREGARKNTAGRKSVIPFRAVLVIELLTIVWGHGAHYEETARTLKYRLTPDQYDALGIRWEDASTKRWYHRLWRAKRRMLKLLDPWHATDKRKRLSGTEFLAAQEKYDALRDDRLYWVAQALLDASVALLPSRYRDRYRGDVALDSTLMRICGSPNATSDPDQRRANVDFSSGTYTHAHREDVSRDRAKAGYELDVVQMMDVRGYEGHPAFARLITGIGFHRPGEIKTGPRLAMEQHSRQFSQRGLVAADRAFNNLRPERLQLPLRRDGWETIFDFTSTQLGKQATVHGTPVIMVDGRLYVHYIPDELIYCTRWFAEGKPNPRTGEIYTKERVGELIAARRQYELKRHGSPDAEGYQRYTYPEPTAYVAYDPATRRKTKSTLRGSVTIPPQDEVVKHIQRYAWKSPEWHRAYGQRNQVESANKHLKEARFTDFDQPQKRLGRGYAFQFLAAALMCVSANLRRLVTALRIEFTSVSKTRSRRRRDPAGVPLGKSAERTAHALAPPV